MASSAPDSSLWKSYILDSSCPLSTLTFGIMSVPTAASVTSPSRWFSRVGAPRTKVSSRNDFPVLADRRSRIARVFPAVWDPTRQLLKGHLRQRRVAWPFRLSLRSPPPGSSSKGQLLQLRCPHSPRVSGRARPHHHVYPYFLIIPHGRLQRASRSSTSCPRLCSRTTSVLWRVAGTLLGASGSLWTSSNHMVKWCHGMT